MLCVMILCVCMFGGWKGGYGFVSSFNAFAMGHYAFFNSFTISVLVLGDAIRLSLF